MGAGGDAGAEESQGNQDASARDKRPAAPKTEPSSWLVWLVPAGWLTPASLLPSSSCGTAYIQPRGRHTSAR